MTPNCTNTIWKHGQRLWWNPSARYGTPQFIKLIISKKYLVLKTRGSKKSTYKIYFLQLTSYIFYVSGITLSNNNYGRKKSNTTNAALKCSTEIIFCVKFPKNGTSSHFSINYPVRCCPEKAVLMQNVWSWYLKKRFSEWYESVNPRSF